MLFFYKGQNPRRFWGHCPQSIDSYTKIYWLKTHKKHHRFLYKLLEFCKCLKDIGTMLLLSNVRYLTLFRHLSELFTKFQPMLEFVKYKIQCTQYIYFQKFYKIHFHFSFYTIHRMFKFQKHPLNSASRYMKALRGLNPWGLLQSLTFNFNF